MQTPPPEATTSPKKVYRPPTLVCFGEVRSLTQATTSGSTEGTPGSGPQKPGSDRRIKENIVRVADHPLGIGLYLFDYKPEYRTYGHGRQFGVMADEVEGVVPAAVSWHPDGYKVVEYQMLGICRTRQ